MEKASNANDPKSLRTDAHLCEDDLSDQAKDQFSIHTEILHACQLHVSNILGDNRLSPIGRHLFCLTLEQNYKNCKNVLNYIAAHPELKATTNPMRPPLIICCLPRTGSTLLHNLLACDPASRALLLTDMLDPVPPLTRSDESGQMQRNKTVSAQSDMFKALGLTDYEREMQASHPAFAYDEDQFIIAQAGLDLSNCMLAPHKDNELVAWWLNDTNKDFAYEYHKTFIQMLNNTDAPRSHWLFKSPIHSLFIDTLLGHYPKSSIIMTHRRLDEVFASTMRLTIAYTTVYFDNNKEDTVANRNNILEIARNVLDTMIRRLIEFRRTNRNIPVIDILYDDLLLQPIDTVRRIYEHFGLAWSEEFELAMTIWLRENPQGKQGRNTYTLEDFGLKREELDQCYEEYNNLFLRKPDQLQKDDDSTTNLTATLKDING